MPARIFNILSTAIFTYDVLLTSTSGQWAIDPSIHFQGLEFDYRQTGQFNLSPCVRDLMHCYEIIKPDPHCTYVFDESWDIGKKENYLNITYHGSACDIMKIYCHDVHGYNSLLKNHWFNMERKILATDQREECRDFYFT